MDQAVFESKAESLLTKLFEKIDADLGDVIEVDLQGGILEIEVSDGGKYVINKHGPNQEIWVSSPASGAWHFRLDPDGEWRATRGGGSAPSLAQMLAEELAEASGRAFSVED